MAQQSKRAVHQGLVKGPPRILMVDGFAGPGRYAGEEFGSPLLMLQTLLEHDRFPALEEVEFLFLFIEQDERRVQHLEDEIAQLDLPANVHVEIQHGPYEEHFGELVDGIHEQGHRLVPTFAFIDPFGYAHASMSLGGKHARRGIRDGVRSASAFLLRRARDECWTRPKRQSPRGRLSARRMTVYP